MISFVPELLSPSPQIQKEKEKEFQLLLGNRQLWEDSWKEMDQYFKIFFGVNDYRFRYTYFRWYTMLTWRLLDWIDRDTFLSVAISRQIPMAYLVGFDVWDRIMWRLNARVVDKQDLMDTYKKIRKVFFVSVAVMGVWEGKEVTVAELSNEVRALDSEVTSADKLIVLKKKIRTILFPASDHIGYDLFGGDPEYVPNKFINLVRFFTQVEPESISGVMPLFLDITTHDSLALCDKKVLDEARLKAKILLEVVLSVESIKVSPYAAFQKLVNTRFVKDASGQYQDIDGVLAMLATIAAEKNDPHIQELYYFDEATGTFQWNLYE